MTKIDILDHGYVKYVDHLGSDLSFTKAARASFAKDSEVWNEKEAKLLNFLVRNEHFSVFRHAAVTLQLKVPLMIARQHWKYAVASSHIDDQTGWNESSRRYVTMEPEFYIPAANEWRTSPENKKQGSGQPLPADAGAYWTYYAQEYFADGLEHYNNAMRSGICAEQARLFLPAYAMYVSYQWTASIASVMHFLRERLEHDAQYEIQLVAQAVRDIIEPLFPATSEAFGVA